MWAPSLLASLHMAIPLSVLGNQLSGVSWHNCRALLAPFWAQPCQLALVWFHCRLTTCILLLQIVMLCLTPS